MSLYVTYLRLFFVVSKSKTFTCSYMECVWNKCVHIGAQTMGNNGHSYIYTVLLYCGIGGWDMHRCQLFWRIFKMHPFHAHDTPTLIGNAIYVHVRYAILMVNSTHNPAVYLYAMVSRR